MTIAPVQSTGSSLVSGDVHAEASLLVQLLLSDDAGELIDAIPAEALREQPGLFSAPALTEIARAALDVRWRTGAAPELIGTAEELRARGTLEELGGTAALAEICAVAAEVDFLPGTLDFVLSAWRRRRAVYLTGKLHRAAQRGAGPDEVARLAEQVREAAQPQPRSALSMLTLDTIFALDLPEDDSLLGDRYIARGAATLIAGPGGIGKSGLVMQLAASLILRRPFLGIPCHQPDITVAMIQTENSARRLRHTLGGLLRGCTAAERALVASRLHILVPLGDDDRNISMGDPQAVARLSAAVRTCGANVVIVDPWADAFAGENENDAAQTRESFRILRRVACAADPEAALVVVHHSRSGRAAAAGAVGWDAGSYARGSKALTSIVRSQINVAPAAEDDPSLLLISCGKLNDGARFDPFAVRFDPDAMRFDVEPGFDLAAWRAEVEGQGKRGRRSKGSAADVVAAVGTGILSRRALVTELVSRLDCSERQAQQLIKDARDSGLIVEENGNVRVA